MTTRATRGPRRRTVVALAVILAVLSAFIVRLVDIQVVRADEHVADSLSLGQLGKTRSIAGARGQIVDTDGTVLASSTFVYDAQLAPAVIMELEDAKTPPKTPWAEASEKIGEIIGKSGDEVRQMVADKLESDPKSQYLELAKGLSTEKYLELRDLGLGSYLAMYARSVRVYPNGAVAGNMLGFLNGEGKAQYGVERTEKQCLAPKNGEETFLVGKVRHTDEMAMQVDEVLMGLGRVQEGDQVVIVAGSPPGIPGSTNALRVHKVGDAKNRVAPAYVEAAKHGHA